MDIHWLSPLKRCCVYILSLFFRLWTRTLSIEIDPESESLLKAYKGQAKICALWHNRLFVAPTLFQRFFNDLPMYGLVSPSKDGAWLTELLHQLKIFAIRGSSKRGGHHALLEMIDAVRDHYSVGITPDGPRGPQYAVKPGIALLAKETHAPIVLGGIYISSAWRVNSWDKFYIPRPFSQIVFCVDVIPPEAYADMDCEQLRQLIEKTLFDLNSKRHFI